MRKYAVIKNVDIYKVFWYNKSNKNEEVLVMRIQSGDYEIVESGMFFMDDKDSLVTVELRIEEAEVGTIQFCFKNDLSEKEQYSQAYMEDDILKWIFYNFSDTGTGSSELVDIGNFKERKLKMHLWSRVMASRVRKVEYTIFWEKLVEE